MMKLLYFFLCLTCQLFFSSFQFSEYATSRVETIENKAKLPILTPTFSERQTAKLQLENGLQAYLISDPNVDKSSAALVVKVGSWEDPVDYPGIAHFLEHMLFLGNKKYPEESAYNRFITEHGGQTNAFTSNDYTGFVFSIDHLAFSEALDRFSSFFKEPLFNPSGVDRELQAIDQEYAKNLENDDIRQYFILKELVNPGHPDGAFSMGNRASLQKVSQETLKNWYKTHYSANLMRLEVISSLPLDQIEALVIEDFSGIPNSNRMPSVPAIPVISNASKEHIIYIDPVKNLRRLTIAWELPFKFADMRGTKPELLVCHILGHEGKNSLLAELKKEKLIEGIQCGTDKSGGNSYFIYLQFDLTDAGVKEVNKVILRCFEALGNLRKKGIADYLVEELRTMTKLNYEFQTREDAFEHILKEAMLLPNENMDTYPEQTFVFQKYDPTATADLIQFLTPENAVFLLLAPKSLTGVSFESKEKWLHVPYTILPIPESILTAWKNAKPNPNIDLPEENPYLPLHVDLITKFGKITTPFSIPHPTLLLNHDMGKVYFAQDNYYLVPTISWVFEIKTPAIDPSNIDSVVMADIYVKLINETLAPYIYPASIGGLNFSIDRTNNGISITISGYSDKAKNLFQDILKELKKFKPQEQKFKIFKDLILRNYQNDAIDTPLTQAFEILKSVLNKDFFLSKQKAVAIRKITFDQFQEFTQSLLQTTYVEGMLYGNMNEGEAKEISHNLISTLNSHPYPVTDHKNEKVIVLPKDQGPFIIESKSKIQGNATLLTIGMDPYTFKERAAQQILMQAIKEPFFSTLRTKQQTGYIVYSGGEELQKHLFDIFAVQSNTHEGRDLLARFELFIEEFLQELTKSEITKKRFEIIKNSQLALLKQPPQNTHDMVALLNKLAFHYKGDFDWINKRIKAFEELSYDEFLQHVYETLGKQNKRRIAILLSGVTPEENLKYKKIFGSKQLREISTYEPAAGTSHE
jgi:insulysin